MSLIGRTIKGTYQIYEEVGQGAAATVYLARDLARNRVVALKAIHPHLTEEGRFLERFKLEAELLSQVQSPHIVQIYDFGTEDDVNYIIMEYVEGKTLSRVLKERGPLDATEALPIARQIARCLGAMSAQGIVHRDIKPGNIMLTPERQVKIMDFGIARGLVETGLTQTGVLGTPYYISPEQAEGGRKLDVRSDIYSLGVVLFEMLTNRVPFEETSPVAVIMQHLTAPIPSIGELRDDVPEEVEDLTRKCLAKLPERRFQTSGELVEAIDRIQPPELQPTASAGVPAAVLQRLQQLAAAVDELQERVTRIESQPAPAPSATQSVAEPKGVSRLRAGLLFLAAFVLLVGFLGIMLPRPSGEAAPVDVSAPIATEVAQQLEGTLPGAESPPDLAAPIATEVARQLAGQEPESVTVTQEAETQEQEAHKTACQNALGTTSPGLLLTLCVERLVAGGDIDQIQTELGDYVVIESEQIGTTGVVPPVRIEARSSAMETDRFADIYVAGQLYSWAEAGKGDGRGYTVVVIDPDTGKVEDWNSFDTYASEDESARMVTFIEAIPSGRIVALAVRDEASRSLTAEAVEAIQTLGSNIDMRGKLRMAHALVGVKGAAAGTALEDSSEYPVVILVEPSQP